MKPKKLSQSLQKAAMNQAGSLRKKPLSEGMAKSALGSQKANLSSGSSTLKRGRTELKVSAKKGSTRLVGDKEEAQVQHVFERLGFAIEETRNSGAKDFDGDLVIHTKAPDYIRAEVKYRNTKGFTINKTHWKDIQAKSIMHGGTPALITVNKDKEQLITLKVEDLALLITHCMDKCTKPPQC